MKKITTLLLIMIITLSGCTNEQLSDNGDNPDTGNTPNNQTEEQGLEVTGEVTIQFSYRMFSDEDFIQEKISEFESKYPNITVQDTAHTDLYDRVRNISDKSQLPDVVLDDYSNYSYLIEDGKLLNLNDYVNHSVDGLVLSNFRMGLFERSKTDTDYYGIPYYMSSNVIVYNKTKLDALGVTIDATTPMSLSDLAGLKDTVIGTGSNQCQVLLGVELADSLLLSKQRYTESTLEQRLISLKQQYTDNVIETPSKHNNSMGMIQTNFVNGTTCMKIQSAPGMNYLNNASPNFEIGVAPFIMEENQGYAANGFELMILDTMDQNRKNASWLFIQFLLEDENMAELATTFNRIPITYSSEQTTTYNTYLNTQYGQPGYYEAFINKVILQQSDNLYTSVYSSPTYSDIRMHLETYLEGETDLSEFITNLNYVAPDYITE